MDEVDLHAVRDRLGLLDQRLCCWRPIVLRQHEVPSIGQEQIIPVPPLRTNQPHRAYKGVPDRYHQSSLVVDDALNFQQTFQEIDLTAERRLGDPDQEGMDLARILIGLRIAQAMWFCWCRLS